MFSRDDRFYILPEKYLTDSTKRGYVDMGVVTEKESYWIHESKPTSARNNIDRVVRAYSQAYTAVATALRHKDSLPTILGSLSFGPNIEFFLGTMGDNDRVFINPGKYIYESNNQQVVNIINTFKEMFISDAEDEQRQEELEGIEIENLVNSLSYSSADDDSEHNSGVSDVQEQEIQLQLRNRSRRRQRYRR
ncbi:hypothetical protein H4219_006290, partial [Mycoemilia scoparia]